MRLYKRNGSAKWWAAWSDKTGKRCRKSTGTDDKALAGALTAKWQQDNFPEQHFGAIPEVPFQDTLLRTPKTRNGRTRQGMRRPEDTDFRICWIGSGAST